MKQTLLKIILQLLFLIMIVGHVMSQCGIRWRGTCDRTSRRQNRWLD